MELDEPVIALCPTSDKDIEKPERKKLPDTKKFEETLDESIADSVISEFSRPECACPSFATVKSAAVTFVFSVLSIADVVSDVLLGWTYIEEEEFFYGILTFTIVMLPGLQWSTNRRGLTRNLPRWKWLYLLSCVFFPIFNTLFKVPYYDLLPTYLLR